MVEKSFSVVAELEDGTTNVVTVGGQTSGEAFRLVRAMPGVRRVGRVTESGQQEPASRRGSATPGPGPLRGTISDLGNAISGPRVVLYMPRSGGEQPFKHLQVPPERPKPVLAIPSAAAKPAKRARPAVQVDQASSAIAQEYRVVKSRRQDGTPYLLQRGCWHAVNGKRAFDVDWEKGFDAREQAETHLALIIRAEGDLAHLEQSAGPRITTGADRHTG
jgi:hypothetical protein